MGDFLRVVAGVLMVSGLVLFFGGMVSAWKEIRAEKAAGLPVTRPGWRKADRDALGLDRDRYKAPGRSGWVVWPLVAIGRPDAAERYLARRAARVGR